VATRPTLSDVAERAQVSTQTVSNVMNAPHLVRPETADRVRAAIEDLGYRPSRAARQLRTRRSMLLGLRLEPDNGGINGSVLDRFLHAVVEAAQRANYHIVLFTAPDDAAEIDSYSELLATSELDGVLLTSTHHGDPRTAWLAERNIAFSTFGRPWGSVDAQHSWVDVDGAAGTRAAVEHLVALGHRRIGFVGWPPGSGVGDDRRAGWAAALDDAGLSATPELQTWTDDGVEAGRSATAELLSRPDPPTAVVCSSDSFALGAHALDPTLAVTGFDDTPVARAVGLTSVAQPLAAAASACLEQVLAVIAGHTEAPQHLLLPPILTVRTSAPAPVSHRPPADQGDRS